MAAAAPEGPSPPRDVARVRCAEASPRSSHRASGAHSWVACVYDAGKRTVHTRPRRGNLSTPHISGRWSLHHSMHHVSLWSVRVDMCEPSVFCPLSQEPHRAPVSCLLSLLDSTHNSTRHSVYSQRLINKPSRHAVAHTVRCAHAHARQNKPQSTVFNKPCYNMTRTGL